MSRGGRKEGERGEEVGEEEAEEHDKYSRFFYKPHFLLALSTGTGESRYGRNNGGDADAVRIVRLC
eukprot:750038-Hanusia_phi.AAC.9